MIRRVLILALACLPLLAIGGVTSVATMVLTAEPAAAQRARQTCPRGHWLNRSGTCTRRGWKHCNVRGVTFQCPGNTRSCRVQGGRRLCVR